MFRLPKSMNFTFTKPLEHSFQCTFPPPELLPVAIKAPSQVAQNEFGTNKFLFSVDEVDVFPLQ
jgi:hypothetical protein